jgi:hypothetical protein
VATRLRATDDGDRDAAVPSASVVVTVIVARPRRARTLLGATRTPAIDGGGATGASVTSSGSGRTPVAVTAPVSGEPALGFA